MLTLRRKVAYFVFALMAVGLLVGGPVTTVFADCTGSSQNSCE